MWTIDQLKQSQEDDPNIRPIVRLMKDGKEQPPWAKITLTSANKSLLGPVGNPQN